MQLFEPLTLLVLGAIAWEDLRMRSIHWWWLPLLAVGLVLPVWLERGLHDQGPQAGYNVTFLALQLGATFLLMMLRHRTWRTPLDRFIGLGDVLFFLVLALCMATPSFLLFLLSGLALCIPAYLIMLRVRPQAERTIPTAGFLAIYLMLWTVFDLDVLFLGALDPVIQTHS
jgi:peptidoglycan/LPS O-acetylase OafA/YrhL